MPTAAQNRQPEALPEFISANTPSPPRGPLHYRDRALLLGHKILIVEDEFLQARGLTIYLRESGATVIGPAPSVARGLAELGAHMPDVAVLDIRLGASLVFPLADRLSDQDVPYIFYSAALLDIPVRHAAARRVEKGGSYECLASAIVAEKARKRARLGGRDITAAATLEAAMPRLQAMALFLTGDGEAADRIVEAALERTIQFMESGVKVDNQVSFVANLIELVWLEDQQPAK